jgi:hypothetical protein
MGWGIRNGRHEKGVRASIQEDLKWPVEDAFKKPIQRE